MSNPYPLNQYGQPVYGYENQVQPNPYNQPYPPPSPAIYEQQPTAVVIMQNYSQELPCAICGCPTQTIPIKKAGGVTYLWCCCLFWFTGILCCIPFCVDSCLDTHLVCMRCNSSKQVIQANCC